MLAYLASQSNQTVNAAISAGKIVNFCLEMGTLLFFFFFLFHYLPLSEFKDQLFRYYKEFPECASERSIGMCFIVV